MTAIDAGASSISLRAAPAVAAIRSAWLAPGFYLALVFGALMLLAIGFILLWRLVSTIRRAKARERAPIDAAWRRQYASRLI
jgi:hypothetical protein